MQGPLNEQENWVALQGEFCDAVAAWAIEFRDGRKKEGESNNWHSKILRV